MSIQQAIAALVFRCGAFVSLAIALQGHMVMAVPAGCFWWIADILMTVRDEIEPGLDWTDEN
jgi:hypothetical protein